MPTVDESSLDRRPHGSPHDAPALFRSFSLEQMVSKAIWLYGGFIGVALALLSAPVFTALWDLWMTREDYSHGFLVPLISLYLIRTRWGDIQRLPVNPAPFPGIGILLLSLAGLLVGVAGGIITLSSVCFIGILTGLTLYLFGYRFLQVLGFPLAYLIFMTPFLDVVVDPLHYPLQEISATVVSALFQSAGVPTYLEGTSIQFPNGILEVAVQCSGAGFLISALAIGVPLAALALRNWWSRAALILIALATSIVTNWMRIALIGAIGYLTGWGPQVHGPLHILQGMLVYWVGLGVLFIGAWMLAKAERHRMKPAHGAAAPSAQLESAPAWQGRRPGWYVALVVLAGAIVWLYGYDRGPVEAKQNFASLPVTIGQWTAVETDQALPVVKIPGADQELMRVYRKPDGSTVRLYIAYLSFQTQGKELVNYLTAPLHQATIGTAITIGDERLPVNIGFWEQYQVKMPLLFWYALNGRSIADRDQAKVATIVQALMRQGSNGALILIAGDAGDSHERSATEMKRFVQDLLPVLRPYLP